MDVKVERDIHWNWKEKTKVSEAFLKVVNRSPEPDGTFREYFLEIHPQCRPLPDPNEPNPKFGKAQKLTALNAVASTFGMTGAEYKELMAEDES